MSTTSTEFLGNERFKLVRRLGKGGFGVVYEVFDRKRNSPVALKTLLRADGLYHIKQEFRTLADVTHPNLVMLYELMSENDSWFFTMELVEGVDLRRAVRGDLPPQHALNLGTSSVTRAGTATIVPQATLTLHENDSEIDSVETPSSPYREKLEPLVAPPRYDRLRSTFLQLAEGVSALHQANILHRDLKPSNVLVTPEGRVVILDFGIARDITYRESPETIHIMGSPPFMAPEQMLGDDIGPPGDWYSFGIMLYEALTGRLPFRGTMRQMLRAKKTAPPPPRALIPGTPEDLNDICVRLLQADPGARPSGADVLRQFRASHVSLPASAPPPDEKVSVLVGRESHLGALRKAYESAKAGNAVVARVHGRSGMGKTALVRQFIRSVVRDDRDAVVFAGRCYERESVAYKALDSLVDSLSQYLKALPEEQVARVLPRDLLALTRLFPVLRELEAMAGGRHRTVDIPDAQELRKRAFQALREMLARISDQHPLLLFIDDLHWGDLDSAEFLGELPRPAEPALDAPHRQLPHRGTRDESAARKAASFVGGGRRGHRKL